MLDKRACAGRLLPNHSGKFITSGAKCLPIIMSAFARCAVPKRLGIFIIAVKIARRAE
jgi:hypothetical protein